MDTIFCSTSNWTKLVFLADCMGHSPDFKTEFFNDMIFATIMVYFAYIQMPQMIREREFVQPKRHALIVQDDVSQNVNHKIFKS